MKKKQVFSVMAAALLLTLAFTGAGAAFTGCPASNEGDSTDAGSEPGSDSGPGKVKDKTVVTFTSAVIKGAIEEDDDKAEVILTFKGADSGLTENDFVVTISSPSSPGSVDEKTGTSLSKVSGSNTRYKLTIALNGGAGPTLLKILNGGENDWEDGEDKGVFITVEMDKDGYTFKKSEKRVEIPALSNFSGEDGAGDNIIDVIKSAANDASLTLKLPQTAETETVQLGADNLPSGGLVLDASNSPANVTIDGGERTVDLTGTATGSLITVKAGVTLTLENITFKGLSGVGEGDNNTSLIKVDGGHLILGDGAIISDNINTGGYGGGVNVGENSTFTMEAGARISGNKTSYNGDNNNIIESGGGGGVRIHRSTFTMNGGIISGNEADGKGPGGGGVCVFDGTFIMEDGAEIEISGNKTGKNGGGVLVITSSYVPSTFTMNGGTIKSNQATGNGGGVYVYVDGGTSTFTKTGGTIYGDPPGDGANTAADGYAAYYRNGWTGAIRKRNSTADSQVELNSDNDANWTVEQN